jgi:hypothetical protein
VSVWASLLELALASAWLLDPLHRPEEEFLMVSESASALGSNRRRQ